MDANTPAMPSFPDGGPVEDDPIQDGPTTVNPTNVNPTNVNVSSPARPKGPNTAAVVLGLVAMVLAGLIIANETMGLQVDWSRLGPGGIVGIGLVLVVLGAIGLVRRHDDT
ncbi:MAG TPA: hypothetical protein VIM49_02470 [Dermatophilaceae bacterium]|jgi:hypothetical protein